MASAPAAETTLAGRAQARPASGWFVQERASEPDRGSVPAPAARAPGSEMLRGVPRTGHPGLGVVALGDDSGDAPANASQRTPHALRHVVVHYSSSVSGYLFAGHYRVSP